MKKFITIILLFVAALACTPTLEIDLFPRPDGDSQTEIDVQAVELNSEALFLHPGECAALSARIIPDNATDKTLRWSSNLDAVATVTQDGIVTAISEGSCVITVGCADKRASCEVTVVILEIPVASVSLDKTDASLYIGQTLQLTAKVLPKDATDKRVTWATSNAEVATVEDGLISAITAGEATITATAGEFTATCAVTVLTPFSYGGMCLEAIDAGRIGITNSNRLTIEYKIDNNDWITSSASNIDVEVKAGEHVWFRGHNESYTTKTDAGFTPTVFSCYNGDFFIYGNLMSLIYGDDYEGKTEITGDHAFYKLFTNNKRILNHPALDIELPAMVLSTACYRNMFTKCSNMTRGPKLPAENLAEQCYASMFSYCTSMKTFPEMAAKNMAYMCCTWMMRNTGIEEAPELPALNLAEACYEYMFVECPGLKKAMSVLPATELAPDCYAGMFQKCEKLESAPALPATDMKFNCYGNMFNGCKALTKAPELPATNLAQSCYSRMFGNSGLTEAPELPAMELAVMCYQYMFQGCTELVKAPVLPATELEYWCYQYMFNNCSKLNYIKADFLKLPYTGYTDSWVYGVAAKGTFVKNPKAVWDVRGFDGIPEGWTVE